MLFIPPKANLEKAASKVVAVMPFLVSQRGSAGNTDSPEPPSQPSIPGITAGEAFIYSAGGFILAGIVPNLINGFFNRVKNIEEKVLSQSSKLELQSSKLEAQASKLEAQSTKLDVIAVIVSLNAAASFFFYLMPLLRS